MRATYMLVKTETTKELEEQVNEWSKHGWTPQGGIGFTLGGRPVQVMTRIRRLKL